MADGVDLRHGARSASTRSCACSAWRSTTLPEEWVRRAARLARSARGELTGRRRANDQRQQRQTSVARDDADRASEDVLAIDEAERAAVAAVATVVAEQQHLAGGYAHRAEIGTAARVERDARLGHLAPSMCTWPSRTSTRSPSTATTRFRSTDADDVGIASRASIRRRAAR